MAGRGGRRFHGGGELRKFSRSHTKFGGEMGMGREDYYLFLWVTSGLVVSPQNWGISKRKLLLGGDYPILPT